MSTMNERTGTGAAVAQAYATGADLMADLLGRPARLSEPEARAEPDGLFTALLARPVASDLGASAIPAQAPVVAVIPAPPAVSVVPPPAPPAVAVPPGAPKPGRVLRRRADAPTGKGHDQFDALLAESIAAMPAHLRQGKCKICGAPRSAGCPGPFWPDLVAR